MESGLLRLAAPAKVNVFLRVVGRRPDGYHELVTWMQKIDLVDHLDMERTAAGITLHCPDSALPEGEGNLAYRAARLFFQRTGVTGGVAITLEKRIPVAAGLGGGSSDAAAVLKGLRVLYPSSSLTDAEMLELGLDLGADVPFFVSELNSALATGVGEKLVPRQPLDGCLVLLVNPGFPVSTKLVFAQLDSGNDGSFALTRPDNTFKIIDLPDKGRGEAIGNDLESVTAGRYPEIGEIKSLLTTEGADIALMTGSGPTVFGLFSNPAKAAQCRDRLRERYPSGVFLAKPLTSF
ncbi:MAG: 4-(cytidine 5'-diphospho)-2-C-methyl-D-erythritol kinase [Thermodesulfobacteriota bacterium]